MSADELVICLANGNAESRNSKWSPGRIYSCFYVITMSSCTSQLGVCCGLLNPSMDNSTVLGFLDTSGEYRSLVDRKWTPYTRETLPRWSVVVSSRQCSTISFICVYTFLASESTLTKPLVLVLVVSSCWTSLLFGSFILIFHSSCHLQC